MPLLSSGKLVSDYTPLKIYIDIARERGLDIDKLILSSEDLEYVRNLVNEIASRDISTITKILIEKFQSRVNPDIAREAYRRYIGSDIDGDIASKMIAEILAKWCIEAAETLGIISIKI